MKAAFELPARSSWQIVLPTEAVATRSINVLDKTLVFVSSINVKLPIASRQRQQNNTLAVYPRSICRNLQATQPSLVPSSPTRILAEIWRQNTFQ